MFDSLSQRLAQALDAVRGQGRLTDDQIRSATRDLRLALLEADVALPVVRDFVARVRDAASGEEIARSLTPGQAFLKIVQRELTAALGAETAALNLRVTPPAVILLCGLQGAGKTTTAAKLALHLRHSGKRVAVVSCDIHRPAAIEQLRTVAAQAQVECFDSRADENPVQIATRALEQARRQFVEVLIVDSAGRTAIDEPMMQEVAAVHAALQPAETLFVLDAMTGQDAAVTAKTFGDRLALTGVILAKADSDTRGGAALSVRSVTGVPVKFLGIGEKLDRLEVFHPDRLAARILGEGDVLGLIEETAGRLDREKAERLAGKLKKRKGLDLEDFRDQLRQTESLGDMAALLEKLPGAGQIQQRLQGRDPQREIRKSVAIINSMTARERRFPALIKASHRRRIAAGSGTQVQDVNRLLRQFEQARDMMKKMSGGGMARMMRGLAGRLPPGMLPRG